MTNNLPNISFWDLNPKKRLQIINGQDFRLQKLLKSIGFDGQNRIMKFLLIFFLSLLSINIYAQDNSELIFQNNCEDNTFDIVVWELTNDRFYSALNTTLDPGEFVYVAAMKIVYIISIKKITNNLEQKSSINPIAKYMGINDISKDGVYYYYNSPYNNGIFYLSCEEYHP